MKTIRIPSRTYNKKVQALLCNHDIAIGNNREDFNTIRRKIFNSEALEQLMKSYGVKKTYELSSGTSDMPAWNGYIRQATNDVANQSYYQQYTTAKGNNEARRAIAFMESCKLGNASTYNAEDICLTEGSTGAITSVFEYFKSAYPKGRVVITVPNYYLYAFAAKYYGLSYDEIIPKPTKQNPTFISVDTIISAIQPSTKLVILTNPTNPTGEVYKRKDLLKLLQLAKKNNFYLMVDELFADLVFPGVAFSSIDEIAYSKNLMSQIIVIKGYSKTKNLPGYRIGYAMTKNTSIIAGITKSSQVRQCFPVSSNFTGLICLDAFLQSISYLTNKNRGMDTITAIKTIKDSIPLVKNMNPQSLKLQYADFRAYQKKRLTLYQRAYNRVRKLIQKNQELIIPADAAFNTFIKIPGMNNINYFDFMINLYITTGVKIEFGPCFGLTQNIWETDPSLGFWLRITFGKKETELREGLQLFFAFQNIYTANTGQFLSTGLSY